MNFSLHHRLLIASLVSLAGTAVSADQPPDPEFLLYLEQMRRVDGRWVDPVLMQDLELPSDEPENAAATKAHKNPEKEGSHED